jgi:vancomycin resistance protein YoaR
MKRILIGVAALLAGGMGSLGVVVARHEERIKPNTFVGIISVGNLNREEAAKRLRLWWETEKLSEFKLKIPMTADKFVSGTPGKLGVTLDDVGSIDSLPVESFWDATQRSVSGGEPERKTFSPVFKSNGTDLAWLDKVVKSTVGEPRPARIKFEKGAVVREFEVPTYGLDKDSLLSAVVAAIKGESAEIPIVLGEKSIPDELLSEIKDVVSSYSTSFPASQTSRNTNLRLASSKLDGMILMPGAIFSFNESVGKRTSDDGYRLAPVLANGRHDVGIGGGICQVSGTLYNTILLADLKIVKRQNHSMPVAYLPVGRDATVSFPSLDLKFQNNTEKPIAISSSFVPGRLTFRILGVKTPGKTVSIETSGHRSWGTGVKYVSDSSLAPGRQKVIEKGSSGHSITTYRVVKENGQAVRREVIDRSNYPGGKRIIAINRSAPKPSPAAPSTPAPQKPAGGEDDYPETIPPPAP